MEKKLGAQMLILFNDEFDSHMDQEKNKNSQAYSGHNYLQALSPSYAQHIWNQLSILPQILFLSFLSVDLA